MVINDLSYPTEEDFATMVISELTYPELLAALIKAEVIDVKFYPRDFLDRLAYQILSSDPEGLDLDIVAMGSEITNIDEITINNIKIPPHSMRGRITDFYPTIREVSVTLSEDFKKEFGIISQLNKILKVNEVIKIKEGEEDDNTSDEEGRLEDQSYALAVYMGQV